MKSIILLIFLICSSNVFSAYGPIVWRGDTPEIQSRQITFKTNAIGIYTVYEDPTVVGVDATAGSLILWQDPASDDASMYVKRGSATTDYSIVVNGAGAGGISDVTDFQDIGAGEGLHTTVQNNTLISKTLIGQGAASITSDATQVYVTVSTGASDITTFENIGDGDGIGESITNSTLRLKSLFAGGNSSIVADATTLTVLSSSDITGFQNIGDGESILDSIANSTLLSKSLYGGGLLSISSDATSILLSVDDSIQSVTDFQNLGAGENFLSVLANGTIQDLSLIAGTDLSLSSDATQVYISSTKVSDVTGFQNIGGGSAMLDSIANNTLISKTIVGEDQATVSSDATQIYINVAASTSDVTDFQNIGPGEGIGDSITNNTLLMKSIVGEGGLVVSSDATQIILDGSGISGGGAGVAGDCCWIVRQHTSAFSISGSTGDNISDFTGIRSDCTSMDLSVDITNDEFSVTTTGDYSIEGYNTFNNAQHAVLLINNVTDATDFYVGGTCSDTDTTGTENTHCPISTEVTLTSGKAYEFITRTSGSNSAMFGDVQSITVENVDAENYKFCKVD